MKLLIIILWGMLAFALGETIWGIVKKSGVLMTVGVLVTVMCVLGLILAMGYADSVVLMGESMPV